MKFRTFTILTLLALLLVSVVPLTAQDNASESFPVTVTDGLGRELTFEEPPQRVVAIYNGNFGNLATLGVRPVATLANDSMLADPRYFEDGESIPSVAAAEGGIDLEAVAAAEPDLIITFNLEEVQSMENIAPVYVPLDTNSLEGLYAETRQLASILGVEDRAEAAISAFQDRLAAYQSLTPGDVSVMVTAPDGDDLNTVWLRTVASPDCQVLNLIASCEWEDPTGGDSWSYQTTPETLLELNPDFIYYWDNWDGTKEELLAFLSESPLWAELDAIQNERILSVPGYSNPIASSLIATTQLLDTFAPLLYPDIFPDGALTDEQVQEVLAEQEASDGASADGFPRTVVDGAGRELTLEAPPERLVTYYNNSFGMLATLGVMPVAQSVNPEMLSDPIYFGEAGTAIPTISWDDGPDLEEVAAADPDLVFVFSEEEAQALEGIAMAFVTPDAGNLEELYDALRLYAELLGLEQEAEAVISTFDDRLRAYQALAPADVSVLKLGVMGENSFWISTLDDPLCQILNTLADCGWESPAETEFWGYEGTAEAVLNLNPDVIILNNWTDNSYEDLAEQLSDDPLWGELSAVQNDRVLSTPGYDNPIASSLPALQKFLDVYMPLLYPDVFDGPLTDEQVQEILAEQGANASYSITDDIGNTLTFEAPPTRFYSFANRDIEMLAALGIEPVGVADLDHLVSMIENPVYFPQPVETVPVPNGEDWYPDFEVLLDMNLDVVFGDEEMMATAEGIDLNIYGFYANNGPSNWREGIEELRKLAALTGREEQAERIIQQFENHLAAYTAVSPGNRSVMIVGATEDEYYISTEISGRCNLIIEVATCPWPDPTGGESWSYTTNAEGLLELDPDVIILDNWGGWSNEEMNQALAADPLWNELTAVKEGRVTPILGEYAFIQGIGPIGNIQWLDLYMPVIYPEAFPDGALTDEQVQEILAETEAE